MKMLQINFSYILCIINFISIIATGKMKDVENFSTYPHMKLYRERIMKQKTYCHPVNCQLSGLNRSQIQSLMNLEFAIRNYRYVYGPQFVYAKWNSYLAVLAQRTAELCLPPTENSTIYLNKNLNKWFDIKNDTVVIVAIMTRIKKYTIYVDLQESILEYNKMFNEIPHIWKPFQPGDTVYIGCGYMLSVNNTHQMDHIVCCYGFLKLGPNGTVLSIVDPINKEYYEKIYNEEENLRYKSRPSSCLEYDGLQGNSFSKSQNNISNSGYIIVIYTIHSIIFSMFVII